MTNLFQRRFLPCPYGLAQKYLRGELAGDSPEWQLHVTAPKSGIRLPFDLSKAVDVTVRAAADPMHFDRPWQVTWAPHGGGPYPTFDGTLTVRADENWDVAALELSGTYDPPMGIAGKVFDAVVGARLAAATAKELLAHLGRSIEERYRHDEDAKAAT